MILNPLRIHHVDRNMVDFYSFIQTRYMTLSWWQIRHMHISTSHVNPILPSMIGGSPISPYQRSFVFLTFSHFLCVCISRCFMDPPRCYTIWYKKCTLEWGDHTSQRLIGRKLIWGHWFRYFSYESNISMTNIWGEYTCLVQRFDNGNDILTDHFPGTLIQQFWKPVWTWRFPNF